jgi:hypothetical protein
VDLQVLTMISAGTDCVLDWAPSEQVPVRVITPSMHKLKVASHDRPYVESLDGCGQ